MESAEAEIVAEEQPAGGSEDAEQAADEVREIDVEAVADEVREIDVEAVADEVREIDVEAVADEADADLGVDADADVDGDIEVAFAALVDDDSHGDRVSDAEADRAVDVTATDPDRDLDVLAAVEDQPAAEPVRETGESIMAEAGRSGPVEPGDDESDENDGAETTRRPEREKPEREWQQPETDTLATVPGGSDGSDFGASVGASLPPRATDADDGRTHVDVDVDVEPSSGPDNLPAALEAILLVVDEPVSDDVLAEVVDVPTADVTAALIALAAEYTETGRGFDLRRAAGGWRLYTRGDYSSYVERFVLDGQSVRLTQAALETLAVIAYRQPVTRSRMSAIRGVNCDGVVRTLTTRGLVEECGTQPESGAFLYRTTPLFLEKLGLDSLDELPPLAPFLPDDVNGFIDA